MLQTQIPQIKCSWLLDRIKLLVESQTEDVT